MRLRTLFLSDRIRTSFWFVPAVLVVAAFALALSLVALDRHLDFDGVSAWWLYGGGAEGARSVLSVVSGSMITVAGVVFSIMMVVLSLAAQQYGPRLLRNLMRDRVTQSVLGVFVATFVYCLIVLRTIRGQDHDVFVPQIAVTVGGILALTSLAVLIYFIHHVSVSIHIGEVIARVQEDLMSSIDSVFPETLGHDEAEATEVGENRNLPSDFDRNSVSVYAEPTGYLEAIADDELLDAARQYDLIVRLHVRPGDFLLPKQLLLTAWPAERVDDDVCDKLRHCFLTGRQRTPVQDVLYAISRQSDVAIRALSPGLNDPYTAVNCLDHLGEGLCRLADRRLPSPLRFDEDRRLRVIAQPISYDEIVEHSLGAVRAYASNSVIVLNKLLEVIDRLGRRLRRNGDRQALLDELNAVAAEDFGNLNPHDLAVLRRRQEAVRKRLEAKRGRENSRAAAPRMISTAAD